MEDLYYTIDETYFEKDLMYITRKESFGKGFTISLTDNEYKAKVFNFRLGIFLCSDAFKLFNSNETLRGKQFGKNYIEGYKKGREYFNTEYGLSNDTLYKSSKEYLRNLHHCYYHYEPITQMEGWEYYILYFPIILNRKIIEQYGFFSGILHEFEELRLKHKTLFETFFEKECSIYDSLPPPPPETNITEIQNNFDNVNINDVYKHFKAGLVDKKYLTEQELIQYLKVAFELKAIPETLFKIKDAPTKRKVMRVFYDYYKNVAAKPHGKQNNYAALLGNYFEGYETENVSSNFNK
jgi:hypothetical protein